MNIKFCKTSRNDSGFTMIELMVSLLIAMVLLGGVFQIFVKSSDGNRRLEGLAEVQDNGRFAIRFIQTALQGTAYRGCRADADLTNNLNNSYPYDFVNPIIGYDATGPNAWTPNLNAFFQPPPPFIAAPLTVMPGFPGSPGADIITVRGATGPAVGVTAKMATTGSPIPVPISSFAQGSILMISDCNGRADVFQKTDGGGVPTVAHVSGSGLNPDNSTSTLSVIYTIGANIIPMGTTSFYLGAGVAAPSSLWVIQGAAGSELVEGVDGMQILYGVTTNTDTSANQYLTAANVQNGGLWASVVSVRIALLLRTVNVVTRNPDINVYNLLGVNYPPGALPGNNIRYNDLRLRRTFTTTITLRNRSF